jgi:hypothetical protein
MQAARLQRAPARAAVELVQEISRIVGRGPPQHAAVVLFGWSGSWHLDMRARARSGLRALSRWQPAADRNLAAARRAGGGQPRAASVNAPLMAESRAGSAVVSSMGADGFSARTATT